MTSLELIEKYKKKHQLEFNIFDSIQKGFHLTFELGGNLENGTNLRIEQANNRAIKIFEFLIQENSLCFFEIYDGYPNSFFDQENKWENYLKNLLILENQEFIKGPFKQTYSEVDEKGNVTTKVSEDKLECNLILGTKKISYNQVKKIISGIINCEMGKNPKITQSVYIYDISKNIGFRIYDDRGCHIWSWKKKDLTNVYLKFKKWIVENEKKIKKIEFE